MLVGEDETGVRYLYFDNNRRQFQTIAHPAFPGRIYTAPYRSLLIGLDFVPNPKTVLILGGGGCAFPRYLHSQLSSIERIDVVEIDPIVVDAAISCFAVKTDDVLHVHIADAIEFVKQPPCKYDWIVVDIGDVISAPSLQQVPEFLAGVKAALTDKGCATANIWFKRHTAAVADHMLDIYLDVFPQVFSLPVQGYNNQIIVGALE